MTTKLDSDNIRGLVLGLALPSMLAQFVSVLYSIVDRMYIGNIPEIGEVALAGVGICGPIVTMISAFASLVGIGGGPLVSIRLGAGKKRQAQRIMSNCFLLLSGIAVVVMLLAFLFKDQLLWRFGASEATFPYADEYMTAYLAGTVFALLSTGMNQFIICQGYSKTAMFSVLLGAALNIVLDPVFIFALGMNVRGAAIATVLSQLASCVFVLGFLFGKKPELRIQLVKPHFRIMRNVCLIGRKRLPLKKPPERGGLFLCVRKFRVKGKLEVIERPTFWRTLLPEIHDLFQNAFQHIVLCLCIREGIVDLKQLFDLWDNRTFTLLLLMEGGQLLGESFNPAFCLRDTLR